MDLFLDLWYDAFIVVIVDLDATVFECFGDRMECDQVYWNIMIIQWSNMASQEIANQNACFQLEKNANGGVFQQAMLDYQKVVHQESKHNQFAQDYVNQWVIR